MENQAGNIIWLIILTLGQVIFLALKIIEKLSSRKKANNNPHPCQEHSDKLSRLEERFNGLKENNKEDHNRIEGNIKRIFTILDERKK